MSKLNPVLVTTLEPAFPGDPDAGTYEIYETSPFVYESVKVS